MTKNLKLKRPITIFRSKNSLEKWGYIELNSNQNIILPFIYRQANQFSECGLAVVELDNLYGIIDTKGNWFIEPKYYEVYNFENYSLSESFTFANNDKKHCLISSIYGQITDFVFDSSFHLWHKDYTKCSIDNKDYILDRQYNLYTKTETKLIFVKNIKIV